MRKVFFGILVGAFLGSLGVVVAQTPTIFSSIRVNTTSDLRGNISSGTGSVTVADDFIVDVGGGADELTIGSSDISILVAGNTGLSLNSTDAVLSGALSQLDTVAGVSVSASAAGIELLTPGSEDVLLGSSTRLRSSQNGSVTDVIFGLDGDNNSGIYLPAVDQLAIATGGVQRALFDSSGATFSAIVSGGALTLNGVVTTDNTTADEVGYKGIPQNSQSGNYPVVLVDAATHILHPSGSGAGDTFTIPANGTIAFPIGSVLTFINAATDAVSIAITTDTMTLAGTTTTGTRTLAQNGVATAVKVTSTSWIINGAGIT